MAIVWLGWHTGWTSAPGSAEAPPWALEPIHTPPPPAPPPGTTSLTIGALGASKTLLVHRQLFVVPQELVVGAVC